MVKLKKAKGPPSCPLLSASVAGPRSPPPSSSSLQKSSCASSLSSVLSAPLPKNHHRLSPPLSIAPRLSPAPQRAPDLPNPSCFWYNMQRWRGCQLAGWCVSWCGGPVSCGVVYARRYAVVGVAWRETAPKKTNSGGASPLCASCPPPLVSLSLPLWLFWDGKSAAAAPHPVSLSVCLFCALVTHAKIFARQNREKGNSLPPPFPRRVVLFCGARLSVVVVCAAAAPAKK